MIEYIKNTGFFKKICVWLEQYVLPVFICYQYQITIYTRNTKRQGYCKKRNKHLQCQNTLLFCVNALYNKLFKYYVGI